MSNNPNQEKRMQQQSFSRGRMRGQFSGVKEKPKDLKASIKRLASYVALNKKLFIILLSVVLINTFITLYSNVLVKDVIASLGTIDDNFNFITSPDQDLFFLSLVLLVIAHLVHSVLQYLSSLLSAHLSVRTVKKLRNDLFNRIVYLPISYIDSHPHGDIMSRMTNDVDNVSNAISSTITSLVSGVITVLGCFIIMVIYSPLLTLVCLSVLVITLVFTTLMNKYVRPLFSKQQKTLGELNAHTEQMVTGYKTIVAYNHQDEAIIEFNEKSDLFAKQGMLAQICAGSMGPCMNFISNLSYFIVCICGALFIALNIGGPIYDFNGLDVATVIMFLTLTKQFTRPINQIAQLYTGLLNALAGAERVFNILDEEVEDFSGKVKIDMENIEGKIDFSHVKFGYVEEKTVLSDFSVSVRSGHKIALVGATGSGKTTIVNLLLRFYDINSGSIKIDGVDIFDISKEDLRNLISIVLQDPVLFKDTIENNVRYGKLDATDEEIDAALEFANCYSFINKLPLGKQTLLTEGATNISLGQRQLITIARAVLANPKILILDEATSSVDTRTEKNIQDAMVRLMKDRTSIIIAHRLSTIKDADLIVVLDKGMVIEMGNHNELINKKGQYYNLYQTQFKGIET